jgi:3'(2'), 5'-bisphosphate nucleotidase
VRPLSRRTAAKKNDDLIPVLAANLPSVVRWAGAVARQLRRHDIGLGGKHSGIASTDALTLADLSVQELLVAALRDMGPRVRACRLDAEESSGDLSAFAPESDVAIGMDPIDGTLMYRDRTGEGYGVMVHVRTSDAVHYSLMYLPEAAPGGLWIEARGGRIVLGPDDVTRPARAVLDALPAVSPPRSVDRRVVLSEIFAGEEERDGKLTAAGFAPVLGNRLGDSVFPLLARGELAGVISHTPNVYDFPIASHLARILGGDAVWAHTGRPIDFRSLWWDERSKTLRLPGIVVYAADLAVVRTLVEIARAWNPERYAR